jgi:hypothetical protein
VAPVAPSSNIFVAPSGTVAVEEIMIGFLVS